MREWQPELEQVTSSSHADTNFTNVAQPTANAADHEIENESSFEGGAEAQETEFATSGGRISSGSVTTGPTYVQSEGEVGTLLRE